MSSVKGYDNAIAAHSPSLLILLEVDSPLTVRRDSESYADVVHCSGYRSVSVWVISCVVEVSLSTFPLFYFAYITVNVCSVCHYCWGERCWSYLWSRSDWHSFVIIIPNMMMGSLSLFTFTCMRTSLLLHVNCTSTQHQACTWWMSGEVMQSSNIIATWVLSSVCSSVQRNLEAYQTSITCTGLVHVVDGLTVLSCYWCHSPWLAMFSFYWTRGTAVHLSITVIPHAYLSFTDRPHANAKCWSDVVNSCAVSECSSLKCQVE